jgi:hypothetical protein
MTRIPVLRLSMALVVLAAAVLGGVHAYAWLEYRGSFPPASLAMRRAAVSRAVAVEPWNRTFLARRDYVDAEMLYARGDAVGAYNILHTAVYAYPGDEAVRAFYKKVYPEWYEIESLKAHVQHGHEGTGGVLTPQDVER